MGCASSKADDLPLVALCRERTELIRAAVNHRYVLAAAHASYFRALDRVGEALNRFAAEELVTAPASPVLTLPPSEGKPPKAKSCGSSAPKGDNASNAAFSPPPSPSSSSVSPFSGSHLDDECHHLDDPSCSETEVRFEGSHIGAVGGEGWGSLPHSAFFPAFPNANSYYMKAAPTMPSTFYQDPRGYAQSQRFGFGYGYGFGYPSFVQENTYSYEPPAAHSSGETRPPPPPPPPPPLQGSSWDFFNPFDSYEKMFDGHAKSRFGLGSVMSSPNSSEVREQEGIPDLEEETDPEYVKETGRQRSILQEKRVNDDDSDRFNSSVGSSEAVAVPPLNEKSSPIMPEEEQEDIKMRLGSGNLKKTGEVKEKDARNERLGFEEAVNSVIMDESLQSRDAALFVQRTRDVAEAVKEITEQFKSAASCGEDVSKLLEVGKIQYRPRIRIFKGTSMLKMNEATCTDFVKYISVKSTNLSSTLAQLYLWEKKLYKEVKDEERLRLFYDKEYSRLKALDGRGAESSKIDSVRATISKLITKISMTIKSIDAISRRIHKLRDEELRPQLVELIHGIIGMWRSMVECHQRQFQAIFEARGKTLLSSISQQGPTAKVTSDLELELSNWCSCFGKWVSAQKAYIQSLNAWLMKWLNQEGRDEAISDGIPPFAPSIFVLSNDWRHAVEQTSEDSVLVAMRALASNLRRLCESQDEERQRKMKADFLSKELARKLNGPCNATAEDGGHLTHLDLMRRRIDEERAKHADAMKQIQEIASYSFKTGLIPVFQALENYSSDTLKCYAELRLSTPS